MHPPFAFHVEILFVVFREPFRVKLHPAKNELFDVALQRGEASEESMAGWRVRSINARDVLVEFKSNALEFRPEIVEALRPWADSDGTVNCIPGYIVDGSSTSAKKKAFGTSDAEIYPPESSGTGRIVRHY